MPQDPSTLTQPVPPPDVFAPGTQQTFTNLAGVGNNPTQPSLNFYGTSNNPVDMGTANNAAATGDITGRAFDEVGMNPGGLVGQAEQDPDKYKSFTPEDVDPVDGTIDKMVEGHEDGYKGTTGFNKGRELTGKSAARQVRRDQRRSARADRKEEFREDNASGEINRSQARKKRRSARQAIHDVNKAAWETYEGEAELLDQENLDLY